MTEAVAMKPRARKAAPIGDDIGDVKGTVGYMMGKLEGIEVRLDAADQDRARMEKKLDAIPEAMRDAFAPLAAQLSEGIAANKMLLAVHTDSIHKLETTDAVQAASIETMDKWKTKAIAAVVALMTVIGGAAGLVGAMYHK